MSEKSTILVVGNLEEEAADLIDRIGQGCDVVQAQDPLEALTKMSRSRFSGIYVVPDQSTCHSETASLLRSDLILERLPEGVAVLDASQTIIWANEVLRVWARKWAPDCPILGQRFYDVFPSDLGGASTCPFQRAIRTASDQETILRGDGDRYLHLHVAPLRDEEVESACVVVTVRDISGEVLQRQKLEAIHRAGAQLTDLKPDEIFALSLEDRIGLLKDNILRFTRDVLKFDVVEIRLLDQQTGELVPLLSEGIDPDASKIKLLARETGNGVTGHVAATGKSYLCEDTAKDELYIEGFKGAKCSLTVPIIHHDEVIGTFNVESPKPGGFTDSDQQ
ncbi:MAG TPA: PAS domain-containing protein, partial [Pirellulaceae bacterium]